KRAVSRKSEVMAFAISYFVPCCSALDTDTSFSGVTAIIRKATVEDVPAIVALERESPSASHWSEAVYRTAFEPGAPARVVLVCEDQGNRLQGFLMARISGEECELENIGVASESQRLGVGTQLMQGLIQTAGEYRALRVMLE